MIFLNFRQALAGLVLICLIEACISHAQAAPIYFDDFDGLATSNVNGTSPDIRPGSETWTAASVLKADGSVGGSFGNDSHAYLPFVPVTGNVYKLSADFNVTGGESTNHFMSLGFSSTANTTQNYFNDSVGLMFKRTNAYGGSDDVGTQLGPSGANGDSHNYDGGALNMKIVLDTQPTLWTMEWFINNVSIRGPVAFATNPTINYVSYGAYRNTAGTVDNFTVIPEPSVVVLGIGAICFLALRRFR